MIIRDIKLTHESGRVSLSADCRIRKLGWDRVYFSVSAKQAGYVYVDASPFAAALLIPSMHQGEDLIIHGSVSQQLYDGLHIIMREVMAWDIGLKEIAIKADSVVPDTVTPVKTGSFFSGGVDAFYTYLKHKSDRRKGNRVESLVLVRGFDIDLTDTKLWQQTANTVGAIAQAEGVELVTVESNIYDLLEPLLMSSFQPWDYTHGGCLAAVGLFLRAGFKQLYIASTFGLDEQVPWGSNVVTDPLWSTESLRFVHDGIEATRLEKVLRIAKSPVALRHLRVCYVNPDEAYNCGRCAKCVRTMIALYVAGALKRARTFPSKLDLERVTATSAGSPTATGTTIFAGELQNLAALRERNLNPELQRAIMAGMTSGTPDHVKLKTLTGLKRRALGKALYFDYAYIGGLAVDACQRRYGKRFF